MCVYVRAETGKIGGKRLARLGEKDWRDCLRTSSGAMQRAESNLSRRKILDFILYKSDQIIHEKPFVNDFGNHNISKYHSILQEKLLQKAHCFDFFNNTQNKQRIPYKQPQ